MIGLASALDRYELGKGASFGYFAAFRVRAAIQVYVVQAMSTVSYKRGGRHKSLVFSLRRFSRDCQAKAYAEGREITLYEVHQKAAEAFGVPLADVERLWVILAGKDEYLSNPIGEGSTTVADTIADESTPDLDELLDCRFSQVELSQRLEDALTALPERTREIVRRRWLSLEGHTPRLDDLAADYQVSRERIRQIEADGLRRLRVHMKQRATTASQEQIKRNFETGKLSVPPPRASSHRTIQAAAIAL
ncbi:hypothetical protein GCM10011504_58200 [Siccirubricoccus deserti]|nr:hypothetical protein GCM10011504_58200 [Siccirubricoccus deserti]